jgi:hypothetical protein
MTKNARLILTFILPWLSLTILLWILAIWLDSSAAFFIRCFSLLSALVMTILYRAESPHNASKGMSFILMMLSITIKILVSAGIFIYYFLKFNTPVVPALLTGTLVYVSYTVLIVGYAYYWSIRR